MGFYDKKIKELCERCPRLMIMATNSIFKKAHSLDAEVIFLNVEQTMEDVTFMDMLFQIEGCKYHWEYQLLEGNMAVRMYEYGVKETVRRPVVHGGQYTKNDSLVELSGYELEVVMPEQTVIFLAGKNQSDVIRVTLTLPDRQRVTYHLPCISASETVAQLVESELYILLPFQQVQLNARMNQIARRTSKTKKAIAQEIVSYHKQVLSSIEKLCEDGILWREEADELKNTLMDVEGYLSEKDREVREEVSSMGDPDYVPLSERLLQKGEQKGRMEGKREGNLSKIFSLIARKLQKNKTLEQIADELEEEIGEIAPLVEHARKYAPAYDIEQMVSGYLEEAEKE